MSRAPPFRSSPSFGWRVGEKGELQQEGGKLTPSGTRQQNRSLCADLACLFPLSSRLGCVWYRGEPWPAASQQHAHTNREWAHLFPPVGLLIEDYHTGILRVLCRCNVYIYILGGTAHNEEQQQNRRVSVPRRAEVSTLTLMEASERPERPPAQKVNATWRDCEPPRGCWDGHMAGQICQGGLGDTRLGAVLGDTQLSLGISSQCHLSDESGANRIVLPLCASTAARLHLSVSLQSY
ncbi:hypothetical protein GOODEAATRI_007142 [Goodea atripinnis]|uniref:Uncharacterized protein n=1 Tax=Goodea atripinnis TaxID=208336 RepID=A0ABV0NVV8_9TELE